MFLSAFNEIQSPPVRLVLTEINPGDGHALPFYYYDIFDAGNEAVGKISIRIENNADSYYNGHIGYEVNEPFRGHGYAYHTCRAILPVARVHGMALLYITCKAFNTASRKTIEKLCAAQGNNSGLDAIVDIPKTCFFWYDGIESYCIYKLLL